MADIERTLDLDPFAFTIQRDVAVFDTVALRSAAETVALGQAALAVDNDAVHGIVVDGLMPLSPAKERVRDLKGHAADGQRPYGLIMPHGWFSRLIDYTKIDESARALLQDPAFVERLGAMTFIRVPANPAALEREEVPACAISADPDGQRWVQNYDPSGGMLHGLVQAAQEAFEVRYPVITSLNRAGETEITDPRQAGELAKAAGMAYVADPFARRRIRGSYPIVAASESGWYLLREGCIGRTVLESLMGQQLHIPPNMQPAKTGYPPLEMDDVPALAGLQGPDLRDALLEYLGWGERAPLRQTFRPATPLLQ